MPRIVSLIASATEIVCALGFEHQLVGRSHECDFPPSVARLPVCTRPRIDVHASSGEIDRQIRGMLRDALSIYEVNEQQLHGLEPDLIVTQSQCEVCAVSLREVERAVCAWLERCPRIVSLKPDSLEDVYNDIEQVALALDAYDAGVSLIAGMQARMKEVAGRAAGVPDRPRVACIEWVEPLMAAGNWVPELVELAGGVNLFGEAGKHSPGMSWEQLRQADPDVIVLMPCGYDLERTCQDVQLLESREGWAELKAVQSDAVVAVDGNQYFNRPGPRLVESLEILAEVLHPKPFDFGHRGKAWRTVSP